MLAQPTHDPSFVNCTSTTTIQPSGKCWEPSDKTHILSFSLDTPYDICLKGFEETSVVASSSLANWAQQSGLCPCFILFVNFIDFHQLNIIINQYYRPVCNYQEIQQQMRLSSFRVPTIQILTLLQVSNYLIIFCPIIFDSQKTPW